MPQKGDANDVVGRGGSTGPAAAGAGKSRLAPAIRGEGERRGFLVATGRAYPMESGVSYSVFCDLLKPLVRAETPEVVVAWTRGAPEFRLLCPSIALEDPGAPSGGEGEIPDVGNRLLWNVPSVLEPLRRDRPLLLTLEDLEWADSPSLELLHFLGRRSAEHPFLIVGTYGSEEGGSRADIGDLARALEARSEAVVMELGPLGPQDVLEAVSRAFDGAPDVIRQPAPRTGDVLGRSAGASVRLPGEGLKEAEAAGDRILAARIRLGRCVCGRQPASARGRPTSSESWDSGHGVGSGTSSVRESWTKAPDGSPERRA